MADTTVDTPTRSPLYVIPETGELLQLFVGADEEVTFLAVDAEGEPVDITSDVITVTARVQKDSDGSFESLTYSIVKAPDQTADGDRGKFNLVMGSAQHTSGRAPGTVLIDVLINNKKRVLAEVRLVAAES